jgi:hypothetical protein
VREQLSFTTTGLISFMFGVALSAASTVLAIVAIALGKASERAMIERSDESIRLQNDVFTRTTEALRRIESSTGVTEKRIEDIIAGRVGAISSRLAEEITEEGGARTKNPHALQRRIQQELLSEFSVNRLLKSGEDNERRERETEEARKRYKAFQNEALLRITNNPATVTEKVGEGYFGKRSDDLVDGVFRIGGVRVGVSTFTVAPILAPNFQENFQQFLFDLAREIQGGTFGKVLLIFDGALGDKEKFSPALAGIRQTLRPDISDNIVVIEGADGSAIQKIDDTLRALQAAG